MSVIPPERDAMGLDGWIWTETALGMLQWADWGEPAEPGIPEFGSWTAGADDGGGPGTAADPSDHDILSLGADAPGLDLATLSAVLPAEAAVPEDGASGPAAAGDAPDPGGDLGVPEADPGAEAAPLPDFFEPHFDFLPTGSGAHGGATPADGPEGGPPLTADALAAGDVPGHLPPADYIPAPEEPEFVMPPGDVFPPLEEETTEFVADDGSVVTLAELTDPDFLL